MLNSQNFGLLSLDPQQMQQDPIMAAQMQQPMVSSGYDPNAMKPNMSQAMLAAGLALLQNGEAGNSDATGIVSGLDAYSKNLERQRILNAKDRRSQLAEYELMGRIRDRQNNDLMTVQKLRALQRLKDENADDETFLTLLDLDPNKAAEYLTQKQKDLEPTFEIKDNKVYKMVKGQEPEIITPKGGSGYTAPFEGTAMDAQLQNKLLQAYQDPAYAATPEYLATYNLASQPTVQTAPDGTVTTVTPDMSAYVKPTYGQAVQPSAASPAMVTPETVQNAPAASISPNETPDSDSINVNGTTVTRTSVGKSTKQEAKDFQEVLDNLSTYYDELHGLGGMVDSKDTGIKGAVRNAGRFIANTSQIDPWGMLPAGQTIGGAIGSPENAVRDKIIAARPVLLATMKKATGMTGQELNSNAEMQFYLNALSGANTEYTSAKEILANLSKLYGTGTMKNAAEIKREASQVGGLLGGETPAPEAPAAAPAQQKQAEKPKYTKGQQANVNGAMYVFDGQVWRKQ